MILSRIAPGPSQPLRSDLVLAVLATIGFVAMHLAGGFASLSSFGGDNDSLMRMVQVRDLIAGQGWFDLHQYRMGVEGAAPMHWSRLVDAPIAGLVWLSTTITADSATAEGFALVVWPSLLFAAALYFILRSARQLVGDEATFPALLLGAVALHFTGVFAPGAIDHHNVQLALTLGVLSLLLDASTGDRATLAATGAGVFSALSLAVGMETAPYVAAAGLSVAAMFLFCSAAGAARGFGVGFAGAAAVCFVATVRASAWGVAQCDAYSVAQFAVAVSAGVGLAILAAVLRDASFGRRLAGLALLGGLLATTVVVFFPQCLADPYGSIPERLKDLWLRGIVEAQPLWSIVAKDPAMVLSHYATPLLGLAVLALALIQHRRPLQSALVAAMLGSAVLVAIWQVRGSVFAIPLATIPLAGLVAEFRRRSQQAPSSAAALAMLAVWLVSINVTWAAAADAIRPLLSAQRSSTATGPAALPCRAAADFERLGALPPTGVLVVSNLGAPVLRFTPQRVLAGPYHRNTEGNLLVLDAFMGPPEAARTMAREHGLTLLALCRGEDESRLLAARAPEGLMAQLMRGERPGWLVPVEASVGEPLEIFRIATVE